MDKYPTPELKATGLQQAVIRLPTQPHEQLVITGPKVGKLRVRDVVHRSNARPTGKYPSVKMGRMLQSESPGEMAALQLFDADPTVKAIHEQPLSILYWLEGLLREHIPDVLVVRYEQQQREIYEVKVRKDAQDPEVVERTRVLTKRLPAYGYSYGLLISEELIKHPFMRTAELLTLHGRNAIVDDLMRERVRAIIEARGHISWAAGVSGALGSDGRGLLCRLTLDGILDFDRTKPLRDAQFFLASPRKA